MSQEKPDLDFEKYIGRDDVSFEFELKVRLPDWVRFFGKKPVNTHATTPAQEPNKNITRLSPMQKFVKSFASATSVIPGHTFFRLSVKKDGIILKRSDIGFSFAREGNLDKVQKKAGVGVTGFLQDQTKKDPRYDYSKSYNVDPNKFVELLGFLQESSNNPPNYVWPLAYNCVKFAKKAAKVAGIKNAYFMGGASNLPMGTVAFIKASKLSEKMQKADKKLEQSFSKDKTISFVSDRKINSDFLNAIKNDIYRSA